MILYFIENFASLGRPQLGDVGLVHAFPEGIEIAVRAANVGPSGTSGIVACDNAERCGYFADDQEWREISSAFGKRRFCGWFKSERPGPASLARSTLLDGKAVRLADGNDWIVPRAYQCDDSGPKAILPTSIRRRPNGTWSKGDVLPRYRGLWLIAEKIFDRWSDADESDEPLGLRFDRLAEVLGANYRVGPDEVGALELFDTQDTIRDVVAAVIDLDGMIELQKKTSAQGS